MRTVFLYHTREWERDINVAFLAYDMASITVEDSTIRKIKSFGYEGESYNAIINRMFEIAKRVKLREFLLSGDAISIDQAIAEAKKRWPRNK